MSAARYAVGDRVVVTWLGHPTEATVAEVLLRGGRPHNVPQYWIRIDGERWPAGYAESEIAPVYTEKGEAHE